MGGASRNDKQRRQDEANRRLAAAGIRVPPKKQPNRSMLIVAIVVAIAVIAGLTVWFLRSPDQTPPPATTVTASATGPVVAVGRGKTVVDMYEDFLCPICQRFEQVYGSEVMQAVNSGQITVRYHTIAILDQGTNPVGYSTRAGNAALCAVPAGVYPAYRTALFDNQPEEGSAGLSNDQLIKLGTDLGASGAFATCVNGGTYDSAVASETKKAVNNPALQTDGQFGTPTVTVNGKKVDLNNSDWLKQAIAG